MMVPGLGDARGDTQRGQVHPPVEMVPERKLLPMLSTSPVHSVSNIAYRPERIGAQNVRDLVEPMTACNI